MAKKGKYTYEWPRPMVTVDAIVFCISKGRTKVLLIQRGNEPFKGQWAFPGGFVDMDEDLKVAAARELEEETGITGIELKQMHTFGKPGRDPRGRNITIVYMAILNGPEPKAQSGDDAAKAEWFDIENPPINLSFDHREVFQFATEELKKLTQDI